MTNYLSMSMCLAPKLRGGETNKIIFFVLGIILFIGICRFWKKLDVAVFLPFLFILFSYSPWGMMLYEKLINMINESTAMFSDLMNIPQWTFSYSSMLFLVSLIFFLYFSYRLITQVSSSILYAGFLVLSSLLFFTENTVRIEKMNTIITIDDVLRYNVFQKLLENYQNLKTVSLSGIERALPTFCLLGLAFIFVFISWKLARSYEWKRISKELQIKWYQLVLFVLLLVSPVAAMLVIGFLPFEHRTFQMGHVQKFNKKHIADKNISNMQSGMDTVNNLQEDGNCSSKTVSEAENTENGSTVNQQNITL